METIINKGLRNTPVDGRDFQFGQVYQLPELSELPTEYKTRDPLGIKNQFGSDLCSSFAVCAVSEDQELTPLSPEYQFARTKEITGDPLSWGADLRSAAKSVVKAGSITVEDLPEQFRLKADNSNRDFIAAWNNWPHELEKKAGIYFKQSYFSIGNSPDVFSTMKQVLWANRREERSILTGVLWQNQWTGAEKGVINYDNGHSSFGHAIKIYGWRNDYLIAQLSNGNAIGDNGRFYFHKDVVNRQFRFGGFTFKDMPREDVKWYIDNKMKVSDSWLKQIIISLSNILKRYGR